MNARLVGSLLWAYVQCQVCFSLKQGLLVLKGEWKILPVRCQINPSAAESIDAEIVTAQQKAQAFWTRDG